ncbi:MAG: HEAT repeat domain-containing protein, partial [Limisphaerales bacterium]
AFTQRHGDGFHAHTLPASTTFVKLHYLWKRSKIKFEEWAQRHNDNDWPNPPRFEINIKSAWEKQQEGVNIIWALGPTTKSVVPDLANLLRSRHKDVAENAMYALPGAGTNAIPPLLELLNDPDKTIRLRAAITLGDFFRLKLPPDESGGLPLVAGSENFRSQARAAVSVLLPCLDDQKMDYTMRIRAIRTLGLIKEEPSAVVSSFLRHVQSETNRITFLLRNNYLSALGNFGTNAAPAVSTLIHILESNSELRNNYPVLMALQKINPEIARPFLEKWKASQTNETPAEAPAFRMPNPPMKHLEHLPMVQTNSLPP